MTAELKARGMSRGRGPSPFTKTIANDLGIGYEAAEKLKLNMDDAKIKPAVNNA